MGCLFLLFCLLGFASATTDLEELTFAAVRHASDGVHTLTMEAAPFADFGFDSRGFNGSIPGPTFRMNPGDTLEIILVNNLLPVNSIACSSGAHFCDTSITNLHTHGLHVSSKGREDGLNYYADDVMAEVEPGTSEDFKFEIPDFHMPGTHWYHPHHHHATALQAGGGAAGVLIVNDPPGYLPEPYASMPERVMMLSGHNLQTLQAMAQESSSNLLEDAVATAEANNLPTNVFLVNGMLGPKMTIDAHTWHRFRMVYAAVEQSLQLTVTDQTDGGMCTFQLLAKDGIYLHSFPRAVETMHMFPGARSDVALACSCDTYPCTVTLGSGANRRLRRLQGKPPPGDGGPPPDGAGGDMATVDLMELHITESGNSATEDLPTTTVQRPCYVVDLTEEVVPGARSGNLQLQGGGRVVSWNNDQNDLSMTYANVQSVANGNKYDWPAITSFEVGNVYEMEVTGAGAHPFHQHINPYQIVNLPGGPHGGGYFQVGDWHDTLLIDDLGGDDVTVRMQTDVFTGKQVLHCHILEHEDEGMMAYIELTGTEGATWSGAEVIDPTCLRSAFVAPHTSSSASSPSTATGGVTTSSSSSASSPSAATGGVTTSASSPSTATGGVTTSSSSAFSAAASTSLSMSTSALNLMDSTTSSSLSMSSSSASSRGMPTASGSTSSSSVAPQTASSSTSSSEAPQTASSSTPATPPTASSSSTSATQFEASASTASTSTSTPPATAETVEGQVTLSFDSGSPQDFVDNFNNNTVAAAALASGIASGIDGVEPEDVTIIEVQLVNTSRRLRRLQSIEGVAVTYEIVVPSDLVATELATALTSVEVAETIASTLNQELPEFSVQEVVVTAVVITTTQSSTTVGVPDDTVDGLGDPSRAAGKALKLLVPVVSLASVGFFRSGIC